VVACGVPTFTPRLLSLWLCVAHKVRALFKKLVASLELWRRVWIAGLAALRGRHNRTGTKKLGELC
jgi:hypothetical protein